MKYDLSAKRLFELGAKAIVRSVLGYEVGEADALQELSQETIVSLKRADYVLRVTPPHGEPWILVVEFLTEWRPAKVIDLFLYTVGHQQKERERMRQESAPSERIPAVRPVMLLFQPSGQATNVYQDEHITFRFHLVKMWELDARGHIARSALEVYPLAALMRGGVEMAPKIEEAICSSDRPPETKADLMNIFATFLGLQDADLARQITKKRKNLMMESPIYQDILREGFQKGLEKGREESRLESPIYQDILEEGLEKGREEGWQKGREEGREQERRESVKWGLDMKFGARALGLVSRVDRVHDAETLLRIRDALRAGRSLNEIERLIAASD